MVSVGIVTVSAGTAKRGQSQHDIDTFAAIRCRIVRLSLLAHKIRSLPGHSHHETRFAE